LLVVAVTVTVTVTACNRWVPLSAARVPPGNEASQARFERMLHAAGSAGYRLVQVEPHAGRFRVIAFSDGSDGDMGDGRTTYFTVQVYANGVVEVSPSGFLVKPLDGVMHKRVRKELDEFLSHLYGI
jgi:hypothetical protein